MAVITGGSIGIGLAVANGLAEEGVNIVHRGAPGRPPQEEARRVAERHGVRTVPVACDVATAEGTAALVAAAEKAFGGADILINNAGTGSNETIMEAPDEKWQHYWELHVMAAVRLARGFVPGMRKRGGGVILHNASICATQPLWYEPIYNVTKSALMMFSKTLANEVVKDNIRVNTINAGLVLTPDWIKTAKQLTADKGGDWEGYLAGRRRRACADRPVRHAGGAGELLRLPVLRPRQLFGRLDLFRRRRHAEDRLGGTGRGAQFRRGTRRWPTIF